MFHPILKIIPGQVCHLFHFILFYPMSDLLIIFITNFFVGCRNMPPKPISHGLKPASCAKPASARAKPTSVHDTIDELPVQETPHQLRSATAEAEPRQLHASTALARRSHLELAKKRKPVQRASDVKIAADAPDMEPDNGEQPNKEETPKESINLAIEDDDAGEEREVNEPTHPPESTVSILSCNTLIRTDIYCPLRLLLARSDLRKSQTYTRRISQFGQRFRQSPSTAVWAAKKKVRFGLRGQQHRV